MMTLISLSRIPGETWQKDGLETGIMRGAYGREFSVAHSKVTIRRVCAARPCLDAPSAARGARLRPGRGGRGAAARTGRLAATAQSQPGLALSRGVLGAHARDLAV